MVPGDVNLDALIDKRHSDHVESARYERDRKQVRKSVFAQLCGVSYANHHPRLSPTYSKTSIKSSVGIRISTSFVLRISALRDS